MWIEPVQESTLSCALVLCTECLVTKSKTQLDLALRTEGNTQRTMIATSVEWELNMKNIPRVPPARQIDLSREKQAVVRLVVALFGEELNPDGVEMFALLMIKNFRKEPEPPNAAMIKVAPQRHPRRDLNLAYGTSRSYTRSGSSSDNWVEVHRALVRKLATNTEIQYPLKTNKQHHIRIEFYERESMAADARELCAVELHLHQLLRAQNATDEYPAVDVSHDVPVPNAHVRVRASWMRNWVDRSIFEVRIRFDKKHGWPFASTRPFFVIYARNYKHTWIPVYRSEVLTRNNNFIDKQGSMLFAPAEIDNIKLRIREDHRNVRIEFFQYKTDQPSLLIGYLHTTAILLRQAENGERLPLHVSNVEKGDLVGNMHMVSKIVTANTGYYSFMVNFGGYLTHNLLLLFITVECRDRALNRNLGRPILVIQVGDKNGPIFFESETPRRDPVSRIVYDRMYFSKEKLLRQDALINTATSVNGFSSDSASKCTLTFSLREQKKSSSPIAIVEANLQALFRAEIGKSFPVQDNDESRIGEVIVRMSQEVDDKNYVHLAFKMDETAVQKFTTRKKALRLTSSRLFTSMLQNEK